MGLSEAISMGIKCIIFHGDLELIINQVQDKISMKHHYLLIYKNRVWDFLESFLTVNMIAIPRKYNHVVNALVGRGARLNHAFHRRGAHGVKVLYRPFVLDNANY